MKKGNSDFINKHKKGCINAASVLMFIIIAGIVVCMTSCGKKDRQEVTEPSTTETEPATTEHPTTEAPTEEAEEGYINPFTGEKTDTDYSGTRPYAIMLNTIRQALPQSGNSKADMYIEMTEEGGITRVLGFYNSLKGVDKIGTIRSTREYFLSWAMGFDAIVVHAGGDPWIFDKINRSGYTTLNCVGNAGIDAGSAFFRDDYRMHNVGLEHSLYTTGPNLLKIISDKNINLAGAEVQLVNMEKREYRLKEKLDPKKNNYDYIIIDCPPSLGLITLNAFTASDSVLIPVQCEYYALEGLGQLMNTIDLVKRHLNKSLEIEGALLTMFDIRTNLSNQVVKEVNKYFENKVYKTVIPRNVKLSEAPSFGMPITVYAPKSKGARCYEKLTNEILKDKRR